ncbi:MAG: hypothetical protein MJK14_10440 [Rivularia sp. ALOHA_DT_140]|nr:hypothetical protein [Rivularia sp. ALOHA_DT_140]
MIDTHLFAEIIRDCSQADRFIRLLRILIEKTDDLIVVYPTIWAIILVRKIFYA